LPARSRNVRAQAGRGAASGARPASRRVTCASRPIMRRAHQGSQHT